MRPDVEEYLREQGWVFAGVSQPDHKRQWAQMDGDKVKRVALESELEDLALEIVGSPTSLQQEPPEEQALLYYIEDERIRKRIILRLRYDLERNPNKVTKKEIPEEIAYLEKQKKHSVSAEEILIRAGLKPYRDGNQWCILAGDNIQDGICGFGDTVDEALYEFLIEVIGLQKEHKKSSPVDNNIGSMTRAEEQLYWMSRARKFARTSLAESSTLQKEQWVVDALYSAYLRGVESAKGIRIIT